jgi:hypothetical protein
MAQAVRRTSLVPEIVFVDGLSGSGKTALLMALSSMQRVEMSRFDHIFEYVCVLEHLGRISQDASDVLIKIHIDIAGYNMMISRSVNFRPGDISSVLNSPQKSKYFARLFAKDAQDVVDRIASERPILNIMTHQVLGISQPLFRSLGKKMAIIEIIRDPLQMVTAWFNYIDRVGTDPLELQLCIDYKGRDLPYFAAGWEEEYLALNTMDRSIKSIDHVISLANAQYQSLDDHTKNYVLRVPFEGFVIHPLPYLEKIEKMLNTKCSEYTIPILKDQNIPRKVSMDIPKSEVSERYGFKELQNQSETDALNQQWQFIKTHATKAGIDCIEKLHEQYHRTGGKDA